ncbi:hypothetical protein [Desulfogranum mediterraneum]|uniref:hypothetical protein n=1 Tax=Desulfogranum mediterraneum TaxID=160661 RepID=UPI000412FC18|nr:hypothetical protein [Desulfogranum mediterraneum]
MLESKQYAYYWYGLDFSIPRAVRELVKRGLKELAFLLLPEDTSGQEKMRPGEDTARSAFKLVFWAVLAIGISLVLGQLN